MAEAALGGGRGAPIMTRSEGARLLALLLPLALLGGALGSQYLGGLHPCEMCYWQRWPHGAAAVLAALALISPASDRTISSTLGELSRPEVRLEMNPADAESRGIEDGDRLRVWNNLGEVRIKAQLTPLVRPGLVAMPKGVWRKHTANGYTSNALTPDALTDLGGGACFNDARVQVEKISDL